MVGRIQDTLEAIYGIRCEARVNDYLVDAHTAQKLGWSGNTLEELLISEEDDGDLSVALFLDRALLDRFRSYEDASIDVPLENHLEAYCQIAEGVSHFLYLSHTADQARTVSLFELETQAEIDKFASCMLQRWDTGVGWGDDLMGLLFDRVSFLPSLTPNERERYEEANRLARTYCCKTLLPHVRSRQLDRFLSALRYSYRLGAQAKVRHLAQTA